MKKGSAGIPEKKTFTSAKKRIRKVLGKAKKNLLPKVEKIKSSLPSEKKSTRKAPVSVKQKSTRLPASAVKKTVIVKKPTPVPGSQSLGDLPFSYNVTKLVLLVRDPEWAYSYWDFSGESWTWITKIFSDDSGARAKLRIHNLGHQSSYDLDIELESKKWYIHLGLPNTEFEAELGILDSKGRFHRIAKSNRVRTPRNGISDVIDPQWDPSEFKDFMLVSAKSAQPFGASVFSSPRIRKPPAALA